jgi:hypothetical protein
MTEKNNMLLVIRRREKRTSYAKNPSRPAQRKSSDEFACKIMRRKTGKEV